MWSKLNVFNIGSLVRHHGGICLPVNLTDVDRITVMPYILTKVGLQNKSTGGSYGREKEIRPF